VKCRDVEWTDVINVKWFYFKVKWSVRMWGELTWFMWSDFILKWSEVIWSVGMWGKLTWFMWSDFILKWSKAKWSYNEVLVDKGAMYIGVTLYCGHLIILWLFHLGISCTVFVLICTVVVLYCFVIVYVCLCVCVFVCVCVCVCVSLCVLVIYILYPDWGFSVLFPQLWGKCQGKPRKDGARPALFQISCFLCCSVVISVVPCIVCV
jgi:hypothetical protein